MPTSASASPGAAANAAATGPGAAGPPELARLRAEVVVLGVFAADLVFRSERLPRPGETLLARGFAVHPGGKGSNQAIGAARAGGQVALITSIGDDGFGALARASWTAAGVIQEAVTVHPTLPTGTAFIHLDEGSGDNAIIIYPGASASVDTARLEALRPLLAQARVFVTQLETPLPVVEASLHLAHALGLVTILNPAPAAPLPDALWHSCDWVTPNEGEAALLTGLPVEDANGACAAADALLARGARNVLMTLGARGALLRGAAGSALFPALPGVQVVDTTGAGDAFNGSLAVALAEGRTAVDAVRFASAAAGLSVGRPGAASSMPDRHEIEAAAARLPAPSPVPG